MTNSWESSSGLSRMDCRWERSSPHGYFYQQRQSFSVAPPLANCGEFVASAGKKKKGRLVQETAFVIQKLCLFGALLDCFRHLSN